MASSTELSDAVAEAFSVTRESAHLHLRMIREHDMITFKGYGRGAAAMTPLDAARLVIAVAGSSFAKDSMATLERFCGLLSDKDRRSPRGVRRKLEDFLAQRIARIVSDQQHQDFKRLPPILPRYNLAAHVALKLMWIVGDDIESSPRVAVMRWFREDGGSDAMSFSPEAQSVTLLEEAQFARHFRTSGLIQARIVTAHALEKIAVSLFSQTAQ